MNMKNTDSSIKEIVKSVVNNLDKQHITRKGEVLEFWGGMVGPKIASHTKAYAIRQKRLYVRVDDSTWAYELSQRYKSAFLERLRHAFGEDLVNDIRFKVGEL